MFLFVCMQCDPRWRACSWDSSQGENFFSGKNTVQTQKTVKELISTLFYILFFLFCIFPVWDEISPKHETEVYLPTAWNVKPQVIESFFTLDRTSQYFFMCQVFLQCDFCSQTFRLCVWQMQMNVFQTWKKKSSTFLNPRNRSSLKISPLWFPWNDIGWVFHFECKRKSGHFML